MTQLSERQRLILALVIRDYIETAQPVGSQRLVDKFGLDFSSATVRNEMVSLTEAGYLRQPHTSAGREPSEEGYRYFVRQLMGHSDLPSETKRMITHQFYQARQDVDQWMRLAASVLAHQSQAASLVTAPHPEQVHFKHVELISTLGRQVLMVLVLRGGEVYRDGLTNVLAEPEFAEMDVARRALRVFEERSLLEDLLTRTILTSSVGGVQVLIGGEGTWEELRQCSMVLARYGAPGLATGALGVLGPIRMAYGRTISTVRYVAGLMSDLVVDAYAS